MMTTRVLALALVLSALIPSPAAAKDKKAEANRLAAEARQMLEDNCTSRECPAFPQAAAKLRKAMKISPNAHHAATYCEYFERARFAQKLPSLYGEAMTMCDSALMYHPDKTQRYDARKRALALRDAIRQSKKSRKLFSDPEKAAKALYGVGFKVRRDGGRVKLGFGDVTLDDLQGFIRDWYMPVVLRKGLNTGALTNPKLKLAMCLDVAGAVRPKKRREQVEQFCEYHAAVEANAHLTIFRGSEQKSFAKPKTLYLLQTLPQGVVYEPLVSIAGADTVDDYASITRQQKMLKAILDRGSNHAYYAKAKTIADRLDKLVSAAKASKVAREKKLARKPIVFLDGVPEYWYLPPIASEGASCDRLYALSHNKKGYVDVEVKVDGTLCGSDLGSRKTGTWIGHKCKQLLAPAGRHDVEVSVYGTRWRKTGKRVNVHAHSIDVQDTEDYKRTKRVARSKFQCVK